VSRTTAARLVSVEIGRPKASPRRGKNVSSGILMTPLEETLRIDEIEELDGDAQANLAVDRDRGASF
jgi:MOSC domain-containing protein YiiM